MNKWIICGKCAGEGKCAPNWVYTADDVADDPDSFREYLAGFHDSRCNECNGRGSVRSGRDAAPPTNWRDDPISRAERAFGC